MSLGKPANYGPAGGTLPAAPPTKRPMKPMLLAAILVGVVVVGVIAFLGLRYMAVTQGPGMNPSIVMQADPWVGGNISINIVQANDADAPWDQIGCWVYDGSDTPVYIGSFGETQNLTSVSVNVTVEDGAGPGMGRLSTGDTIHISVTPASPNPLQSGRIMVHFKGGSQLGVLTLP